MREDNIISTSVPQQQHQVLKSNDNETVGHNKAGVNANLELRALDRQDTDGVIRDFSDSDDEDDGDIDVKDDAQGVLADNIEGE